MVAPSTAKTAGKPSGECPICDGEGYVTAAGETLAVASLCSHLAACRACRGKGFVAARDELGYEVLQPCQTCHVQAIKRRVQFFNQAGVPAAYCNATLDNWKPHTAVQRKIHAKIGEWQAFVARNGTDAQGKLPRQLRGIGLTGVPGVGKTHLMAALARSLTLELAVQVRFADFSQLLWDLKAGFQSGRGEPELVAPLANIEVLFIDELGKGRASEWEISILDSIVSARYNRGLTTFFSTNYPLVGKAQASVASGVDVKESLAARVSDRIVSRLSAMCDVFEIDGVDQRPTTWTSRVGRG